MFDILLHSTTDGVHLQITGEVDLAVSRGALSRQTRSGYDIVCWGDPAAATEDTHIANSIVRGTGSYHWGRSWIAVNTFNKTVKGCTDAIGGFPILIRSLDTGFAASNSRRIFLHGESGNHLNPQAMRELLAFGQVLDNNSILKGVTHLPGRTRLLSNKLGQWSSNTKTTPMIGNVETRFDDALDALVESVRKSVQRNINVAVSLSGGLDSRLLLAAVLAVGGKPTGLTYGNANSADVQIAKQLAAAANIPLFTSKPIADDKHWETFQQVARHGCGEVPVQHAHAIIDPALLQLTRNKTLITGTGAETLRAFYYDRGMPGYSILGSKRMRTALMPHARRYIVAEFMKTGQPFFDLFPMLAEPLSNKLAATVDSATDLETSPANVLDNFYLQKRVPRMVCAGQQMLDSWYFRSHPFLDKDVLAYAGHLPVRYRLHSRFHRQAIEKLNPKLARINWDKTNQPLNKGLSVGRRYPALANKLGLNYWGKASAPMYDYQNMLNKLPLNALIRTFENAGVDGDYVKSNIERILAASNSTHLLGFSAVWSYLANHVGLPLAMEA